MFHARHCFDNAVVFKEFDFHGYFSLKASKVKNLEEVSSRRLLTKFTPATNHLL